MGVSKDFLAYSSGCIKNPFENPFCFIFCRSLGFVEAKLRIGHYSAWLNPHAEDFEDHMHSYSRYRYIKICLSHNFNIGFSLNFIFLLNVCIGFKHYSRYNRRLFLLIFVYIKSPKLFLRSKAFCVNKGCLLNVTCQPAIMWGKNVLWALKKTVILSSI